LRAPDNRHIIVKLPVLIFLIFCTAIASAQTGTSTARSIGQYPIIRMTVSSDTVALPDSAIVTAEMRLDCMNTITRIDTTIDTAASPKKILLGIYGTVWNKHGRRPYCRAKVIHQSISIHFPNAGQWIIEAKQSAPDTTEFLRDTLLVR
jgi:hypothetical protein